MQLREGFIRKQKTNVNFQICGGGHPIFVKLLAQALTNLVLDLANLVTNLAKPSLY